MSNRAKQRRIGKRAIQAILQEYTLEELKKMCWEKEEKESAGEWPPMENGVCCDECRDDPCSCKPFCELPQNGDWKRFGGMAKGKPFLEEALEEASKARHEDEAATFRLINQINLNLQKIYSWHDQEIQFRKEILDFIQGISDRKGYSIHNAYDITLLEKLREKFL